MNLIMWAKNSTYRTAAAYGFVSPLGYPKEKENDEDIDVVCLSSANDRDYKRRMIQSDKIIKF